MIKRKTLNTIPGEVAVNDTELVYCVKVHWVSRTDQHYKIRAGGRAAPGDLEVVYEDNTGTLRFLNEFNTGEKVNVVYEV